MLGGIWSYSLTPRKGTKHVLKHLSISKFNMSDHIVTSPPPPEEVGGVGQDRQTASLVNEQQIVSTD